jgi:NADH-quinone oxidoreductase subunit H
MVSVAGWVALRALPRASWLARLLALVAVGFALLACRPASRGPELLQVVELSPRAAWTHDRLDVAVLGLGTTDARTASVELVGELRRAGQAPVGVQRVEVPLAQVSLDRVSFELTDALVAELCGRGDDARHTTFVGEARVVVHPSASGRSAVHGTLRGVVLDVFPPPARTTVDDAREAAARAALEHFGITLEEPTSRARGLVVASAAPEAALATGDTLLAVDGVHVFARPDVVPRGGSATSALLVRGRDGAERTVEVDVLGFAEATPAELAVAAGVLVPLAAWVLLLASPLARGWALFEAKLGARARRRRTRSRGRVDAVAAWLADVAAWPLTGVRLLARELGAAGQGLVAALAPWLVFGGVSVMLAALPLGQRLAADDLDLGVLVAPSVTLLVGSALWAGARTASRWYWAPLSALAAAARALVWQVPVLAALGYAVARAGSLRLSDLVAAQAGAGGGVLGTGGWPWFGLGLREPLGLVLFAGAVATLAVEQRFDGLVRVEDLSDGRASLGARASESLSLFADWTNVFVTSGLLSIAYLGGWALPGATEAAVRGMPGAAIGLFLAKSWLVVLVVVAVRWTLRWSARHLGRAHAFGAALSLAVAAGALVLRDFVVGTPAETCLAAATTSTAALLGGLALWRAQRARFERTATADVNPFL